MVQLVCTVVPACSLSLVYARHTIWPVPSWWANTALSSLLHLLCKPIFSIHHPMILMIFLRRSLRTMHSAKQCLRNCIRYAPPRRCHCQPEEGHSGESGMTRCCRSTSMVVTFGVSASARESKAMWVVLCVRGIRLEAEWEALDRPLAFHSNSIQPFPPCALPPLLHPRLKAPSRSYPVRQLLLHHVPRWNVHRLHRCGLWNAGASLCHHKQGGKLVCNIHTYIPSSLTYIQTGRGSPLTSIVTASILTASSTRQGPPPPPCAWRAAPEPTPAPQVRGPGHE